MTFAHIARICVQDWWVRTGRSVSETDKARAVGNTKGAPAESISMREQGPFLAIVKDRLGTCMQFGPFVSSAASTMHLRTLASGSIQWAAPRQGGSVGGR
jgi:hypothetical protein